MTIFLTIISGVITYVLGQAILKILLEPAQEMRRTVGSISHALIQYANVISNPGVPKEEIIAEASNKLRTLSSEIQSHLYLVPMYEKSAKLFMLPSQENVLKASKNLIGLSNSLHTAREKTYENNAKRVEDICDALDIYLPE